jgi:hypothetical protein
MQGIGCLGLGSITTSAAYAINTDELLMIAAGGTMASTSGPVVALALLSTVAASGCAVGAIAIPILDRWYEDSIHYLQSWRTEAAQDQGQSWWQGWWSW